MLKHHVSISAVLVRVRIVHSLRVQDNWQHADLHPGNIIVLEELHTPGLVPDSLSSIADCVSASLFSHQPAAGCRRAQLAIIDAGMTVSLSQEHFEALLQLYGGIADLDGGRIGASMTKLRFHESTAEAVDLEAFQREVESVFIDVDHHRFRTHTQEVVAEVLETMRRHRLTMDGAASSVLLTVLALEGWATKLDPDIHILESISAMVPRPWTHRIPAIVDRLVQADVVDSL